MTDDDREWIAEALENEWGREAWMPEHGLKLAAMIRADGKRIKALEAGIRDVMAIIEDSRGVDGFHLNGDTAPWEEVLGTDFDVAVALLTAAREQQGEE